MCTRLVWLVAAAFVCAGATAPSARGQRREPAPEYAGLVGTYCVTCHNDRLKTAGLSLQSLALTSVPEQAQVWEKVARKLRSGEMPPATVRSRPDSQMAGALVNYLETTLDRGILIVVALIACYMPARRTPDVRKKINGARRARVTVWTAREAYRGQPATPPGEPGNTPYDVGNVSSAISHSAGASSSVPRTIG